MTTRSWGQSVNQNLITKKNLGFVIRNWFPNSFLEHRKLSFQVQKARALSPQIEDAPILSHCCDTVYESLRADLLDSGRNFRGITKLEPFRPDEIEAEPFPLMFYCRDCHRLYREINSLPKGGQCRCSSGRNTASAGLIYQVSQIYICPNCGEVKTIWDMIRDCRCSPDHIHYQVVDPLHPYGSAQMSCDIHHWTKKVRENMFCSLCRKLSEPFPVSSSYLSAAREVFIEGQFQPSTDHQAIGADVVGGFGMQKVEFGSLGIVELVYGYRVDVPSTTRAGLQAVRPFMHPTEDDKALALSRILKTKALKVQFDPEALDQLKDQQSMFLHSFKHLFLWASPHYTGLSVGEILGVIATKERGTIYFYDGQPGGMGGCEALANPSKFLRLIDYARRFVRDHEGCVDACKKCLFLPHGACKDLNRGLDRRLLLEFVYHTPAQQFTSWEDVRAA